MLQRPETFIIKNNEANCLLSNIETAKKLLPFFLKAKNLTEAASEMKIEANSYYYWIKKFLKLGLLILAYKKKRAGSSIKYYITPAKNIFLKAEPGLISIRDYFGQATSEYNSLIANGIVESLASLDKEIGILISNNKRGALSTKVALLSPNNQAISIRQELLKSSSPAAFSSWNHLRLSHGDAKEFQAKLAKLVESYEAKASPKQRGYFIQLAIVPES